MKKEKYFFFEIIFACLVFYKCVLSENVPKHVNVESTTSTSASEFDDNYETSPLAIDEILFQNETFNETQADSTKNETVNNTSDYLDENATTVLPGSDLTNETETTDSYTPPNNKFADENEIFRLTDEDICMCDLMPESCEVNCCCDEDCSEDDIKVFTHCITQIFPRDDRYCFQSNIIYKNNTVYKGVINSDNGLFCIFRDNFKNRFHFKDVPKYSSLEDFKKLSHPYIFSWDISVETNAGSSSNVMKAGDPLFITSINASPQNVFNWRLPSQCFTKSCQCSQDIVYMEDMKSSCTREIKSIENECKANNALSAQYYGNFCLQKFSDTSNMSSIPGEKNLMNSTSEESANFTSQMKTNILPNCISTHSQLKPVYHRTTNTCLNIVTGVHYVILHEGIKGIRSVTIDYTFGNATSESQFLMQHFSVEFKWNDNSTNVRKRSGNPGYRFGFPVLAGDRLNITDKGFEEPVIQMHDYGLTILKCSAAGLCSKERKMVKFGHNVKTGCIIRKKAGTCKDIQEQIFSALLGSADKTTYVGTFGNSDVNKLNEWIEIFHEGKNSEDDTLSEGDKMCDLILGLKIDIGYAAVGSQTNPQYKIIGIVYRYLSPQPVDFSCTYDSCSAFQIDQPKSMNLHVTTSVTFFDISETAVPMYKKIPVVDVKLPHDFFYPFLLSSGITNISCYAHLFLIVMLNIIYFIA